MASEREREVFRNALLYVLKRQVQGRSTLLRQVGKRTGTSIDFSLGLFDNNHIDYILVSMSKGDRLGTTRILIRDIPDEVLEMVGLGREVVTSSFKQLWEESDEIARIKDSEVEGDIKVLESHDPYARYRITQSQFEILENQLISYEELESVAKQKGYRVSAIRKAIGGDRMKYTPVSAVWRPFVLGKKRYYLRDVLRHLQESDLTYENEMMRLRRKEERIRKTNPQKRISFSRRDEVIRKIVEREAR